MTPMAKTLRVFAAASFALAVFVALRHGDAALRQAFIAGGLFGWAVSTLV